MVDFDPADAVDLPGDMRMVRVAPTRPRHARRRRTVGALLADCGRRRAPQPRAVRCDLFPTAYTYVPVTGRARVPW